MLVGLQGSGKTTTCGKLARWVQGIGRNPLLVSFDLKRPAAQDQLKTIAGVARTAVLRDDGRADGQARDGPSRTSSSTPGTGGYDPLIVDTAGRLHVDDELMDELKLVRDILDPVEVIYVGDAMTGQDAVKSAQAFEERIGLTSVILTKLDGDARGGAALSIVSVTGKPIKFVGVGEKFDKLEVFHPDRMASRILGMGDILSLIEKAEEKADVEEAEEMARKLRKQEFTLEDFRKQLGQMKKMGSLSSILGMLPNGRDVQGSLQGPGRRPEGPPFRGHHRLHDPGGAREPEAPQRQPPPADRQGQRPPGLRGQPAPQAVRGDAEDDEGIEVQGRDFENALRGADGRLRTGHVQAG